jgi:hypothetical protein
VRILIAGRRGSAVGEGAAVGNAVGCSVGGAVGCGVGGVVVGGAFGAHAATIVAPIPSALKRKNSRRVIFIYDTPLLGANSALEMTVKKETRFFIETWLLFFNVRNNCLRYRRTNSR